MGIDGHQPQFEERLDDSVVRWEYDQFVRDCRRHGREKKKKERKKDPKAGAFGSSDTSRFAAIGSISRLNCLPLRNISNFFDCNSIIYIGIA
jgi:hypothetical protein